MRRSRPASAGTLGRRNPAIPHIVQTVASGRAQLRETKAYNESSRSMELFHFICEKHGLDGIRNGRLKISEIQDLNDPFELLPFKLSNKDLRDALHKTKEQISSNRGMLCFSKTWSNPVLWSHYADKHRGLCLGFAVPDNFSMPVRYTAKRLDPEILRPP